MPTSKREPILRAATLAFSSEIHPREFTAYYHSRRMCGCAGRVLVVFLLTAAGAAAARECRADGPPAIAATQPLTREKRGLSIGLGLGPDYGGWGLQIRYDIPIRPWLNVAPLVGAGWFVTGRGSNPAAGAAGLTTGFGYRNRLTINVALAPITAEPLDLHGTEVDWKPIYGFSALVGYEYMTDAGFSQRIAFGYGFALWGRTDAYSPKAFMLTLGSGVRLW